MANVVANLVAKLSADATGMIRGLAAGDASMKKSEAQAVKTASAVKLMRVAALGAAAGAGVLGVAAFKAFNDVKEGTDAIKAATGAQGKQLDSLTSSYKKVASGSTQSFKEVGGVIGEVNTRLGLTGRPLEDISDKILKMSRITETDAVQSTKNVTRVFGDWAVQTKDQSSTLDKLFEATKQTGIGMDELTQLTVRYGSPMRQLGFNFEETISLFGKFEKEGVNLEAVMSGMRMGLAKMARDGEEPADALQRITKEIKNAGSTGEATSMALEAFGARAGPDMAAAIREGRFEIDEMVKSLGQSEGSIESVHKATLGPTEKMKIAWNKLSLALEPLGAAIADVAVKLIDAATPAIETLGWAIQTTVGWSEKWSNWASENKELVRDLSVVVGVGTAGILAYVAAMKALAIYNTVKKAIVSTTIAQHGLNTALRMNPIGAVITALTLLVAGFVVAYRKSETFRDIVNRAGDAVKRTWEGIATFFRRHLPNAFQAAKDWVSSNWPAIVTLLSGPFAPITAVAADAFGIRTKMVNTFSRVKDWVSGNWREIITFLSGPFAPITAVTADAFGIRTKMINTFDRVKTWVTNNWGAIKSLVRRPLDVFGGAGDNLFDIAGKMERTFGRVKTWVNSNWSAVGKKIKNGLVDPIQDAGAAFYNAVRSPVNSVVRGINAIIPGAGPVPKIPEWVPKNARGTIARSPTLGIFGEAGPEALIPMSGSKRQSAIPLLEAAARAHGMHVVGAQYANGGIAGTGCSCPSCRAGKIPQFAFGGFFDPLKAGVNAIVGAGKSFPGLPEVSHPYAKPLVGDVYSQIKRAFKDAWKRALNFFTDGKGQIPGKTAGVNPDIVRAASIANNMLGGGHTVTSGVRNTLVKGSNRASRHNTGDALDISKPGWPASLDPMAGIFKRMFGLPGNVGAAGGANMLWRTMIGGNHFNHIHLASTNRAAFKSTLGDYVSNRIGAGAISNLDVGGRVTRAGMAMVHPGDVHRGTGGGVVVIQLHVHDHTLAGISREQARELAEAVQPELDKIVRYQVGN